MGTYWRSKTFQFFADQFEGHPITPLSNCPGICDEHIDPDTYRSLCFRADIPWNARACGCEMKLLAPINVPSVMPGQDQKITLIKIELLGWADWGTTVMIDEQRLRIYGEGAQIFDQKLLSSHPNFRINQFTPNLDISRYTTMDIGYLCQLYPYSGALHKHAAYLTMDCEYYTETPPATCNVSIDVYNRNTGELVHGAYVRLKSGLVVIADGYTDGGGVIFNNVPEGDYTLEVKSSGFHTFETQLTVLPPSIAFDAEMTPLAQQPIPWWTWWLVGGVVAIGAITILPSVLKREKPIYVVR